MMHEFSRRSIEFMKARSVMLVSLPFFSPYIEANVRKETDKDRLIILEAAGAFAKGRPARVLDLEDIFEKTKVVDRAFMKNLHIPSFSLSLNYGDIADVRIRRIRHVVRTVYRLLECWPDGLSFTGALRSAYSREEFKTIVTDILRLYSEETRLLSGAIRIIPPFQGVLGSLAEDLFHAMEDSIGELAAHYGAKLYGTSPVHA